MAAQPQWLLRIPEIRAALEELAVGVVDRAIIERLFRLKRRQAITLMHSLGGYLVGRAFLIDRTELIRLLEAMRAGTDFEREARRRQRLSDELDRTRRHQRAARVTIPVAQDVFSRKVSGLADGIALCPGRLEIKFRGTEDLLSKLFEIAQAAANDYDRFQSATAGE